MAKGTYATTRVPREGFVVRNTDTQERVSFKVINNDFLLKIGA